MGFIPEDRRVRRLLKIVGAVVALIILVWVGAMVWQPIRVAQLYEEIDALGIPLSPNEIAPPPLADEDNAAFLYLEADRLFMREGERDRAMQLALKASEMPEAQWLDFENFPRFKFRLLDTTGNIHDLFYQAAIDALPDEDDEAVWRYALADLRFANSVRNVPELFQAGNRWIYEWWTVLAAKDLYQRGGISDEYIEPLRNQLGRLKDRTILTATIDLEIAIRHAKFSEKRGSNFLSRPLIMKQHEDDLAALLLMRQLASEPYYAAKARYVGSPATTRTRPPILRNGDLNQRLVQLFKDFHQTLAQVEVLEIAFAVQDYIAEEGTEPLTLEALVPGYLSEAPIDPFSGKPYIYLPDANKLTIYSVGPNGIDNGRDADDIWVHRWPLSPASL